MTHRCDEVMTTVYPDAPCQCMGPGYENDCMCGTGERIMRWVRAGNGELTKEQREWMLDEIGRVEGYRREEHVEEDDRELIYSTFCAWTDYCRDKGLI